MEFEQLFATIITENDEINYNSNELSMGIKVESEHKDAYDSIRKFCESKGLTCPFTNKEFYTIIAKAHLREFPKYYTHLKKMESDMKSSKGV